MQFWVMFSTCLLTFHNGKLELNFFSDEEELFFSFSTVYLVSRKYYNLNILQALE